MTTPRIAVVGNGVCAITAITEMRKRGGNARIDVFSDEGYGYYPRPRLIDYIAGRVTEKSAVQYGPDWYESQGVTLMLNSRVSRVNPSLGSIETDSGGSFAGYDHVLLACGSKPFVPPIKGADSPGVYTLRTLADAVRLRATLESSERPLIVGGGILGVELAAAMKEIGKDPLVVTNISQLLPAQLDASASEILAARLKRMGIGLIMDYACVELVRTSDSIVLRSSAGQEVPGDLVVIATGVRPDTDLARSAGIDVGRGIRVNAYMQTSSPRVFAAGDCIEWKGVALGIIPVALDTAKVAVRNMLEMGSVSYTGTVPSNTLQVTGIDLTSIGVFNGQPPDYDVIAVSDPERETYFKAVVKGGTVVGGIAFGDRKVALRLRQLVNSQARVKSIGPDIFWS
ncbi:MAG: FAD-dependent oxidoreductase [Candidatus Thorarchaeota archaeon]